MHKPWFVLKNFFVSRCFSKMTGSAWMVPNKKEKLPKNHFYNFFHNYNHQGCDLDLVFSINFQQQRDVNKKPWFFTDPHFATMIWPTMINNLVYLRNIPPRSWPETQDSRVIKIRFARLRRGDFRFCKKLHKPQVQLNINLTGNNLEPKPMSPSCLITDSHHIAFISDYNLHKRHN